MNTDNKVFKILIVDDIPKNIQVVANVLKNEGYKMTFARDGKSALEKVRSIEYDLILLDIMMPEMDGFEVCSHLKNDPKHNSIPVIFLTAKSDTASIVKGLESGAVDYINKPFNHAELIARVRTQLQMKQIREKLVEANATKDKFFSIIAHDLRNPFNHLLGFSEILLNRFESLSNTQIIKFINNIHSSAQNMYRLLENLLSWSSVQLGTFDWLPVKFNVNQVVNETIDLLKAQAFGKKVSLNSNLESEFTAYGDVNMITTVVRNLISNAIKFTPENGRIDINALIKDTFLNIFVKDSGVGISEENSKKLFQISNNFSCKGTNDEVGTGLGLILCKEFVEKNGGKIWVESKVGEGSQFWFTIPINRT
ncbi:hybrid sensor histidine kinase/response regulator [bacterium]|nr:hybrid sensor histidine kinase/response regulator [bacterium]